jgi:hypothetical protein
VITTIQQHDKSDSLSTGKPITTTRYLVLAATAGEASSRTGQMQTAALLAGGGGHAGGPKKLERFRAKWVPVRVKKTRQFKIIEPRF